MPIQLPHNHAFTLWTRPTQVTPIPMKNGLTAAELAAARGAVLPSNPPPAAARPDLSIPPAVAPVPFLQRILPLAAGAVAALGLHALVNSADTKNSQRAESERSQQLVDYQKKSEDLKALEISLKDTSAQIQAKSQVIKTENDRLITDLTQAQESLRKATARSAELEILVRDLTKTTDEAKLAAATADTKAQAAIVAAMEEASTIKREAAAAVPALHEALARLEAEKAAALKAAATAIQERDALHQALEAAKKPAP